LIHLGTVGIPRYKEKKRYKEKRKEKDYSPISITDELPSEEPVGTNEEAETLIVDSTEEEQTLIDETSEILEMQRKN
jgi:hypothetical protein